MTKTKKKNKKNNSMRDKIRKKAQESKEGRTSGGYLNIPTDVKKFKPKIRNLDTLAMKLQYSCR